MDNGEAERLARTFAPAVYRLCYARTGSRTDAEDLMQETFLRLVRTRPDFEDDAHARAWLFQVALHCVADLYRVPWRRREEPVEEVPEREAAQAPEEDETLEAVLSLPPKYRAVIHLYYYEELSVAEIARVTGKSEGTIRTRMSRARVLLRDTLEGGEARV